MNTDQHLCTSVATCTQFIATLDRSWAAAVQLLRIPTLAIYTQHCLVYCQSPLSVYRHSYLILGIMCGCVQLLSNFEVALHFNSFKINAASSFVNLWNVSRDSRAGQQWLYTAIQSDV